MLRDMDLGILPWFLQEFPLKLLCLGADPQSAILTCSSSGNYWGQMGIINSVRKKLKISENTFHIAWVVDLLLMENHFPRENTENIGNIGCFLSQSLSNINLNSSC